jgi:hypothetical protein
VSALAVTLIAIFILIAVFGVIFSVFHFGARETHGGVEEPPEARRRGTPPFEGIERDTSG